MKRYADEAYSATTDKRPQFQQMITDSENKEFDVVLVHKLDRFARNRYDSIMYKQKLRKNGIRLYSVLERIDNSPESILLEGMIESINEFYSANLARESMKGLMENALKCLYNGGCTGLGYDVDETQHIVINEEEAKVVAAIFSLYLCGYSCKNIADMLNAEGHKTKVGNSFTPYSVYGILNNEKYTGVYIFNRAEAKGYDRKRNSHRSKPPDEIIRIEGGIPAIISKEVWEAVKKRQSMRNSRPNNAKTMYLLSKKMICGACGSIMQGTIRYRKRYKPFNVYVCRSRSSECDNLKEIDRDSLESFVIKTVLENCDVDNDFLNTPHDSPKFRQLLQSYIDSIVVLKRFVKVRIYSEGEIKTIQHRRSDFKTATQRYFKSKKAKRNNGMVLL